MTVHRFSLLLTGWLLRDMCHCFVGLFIFFKYRIIFFELKANFKVRRHFLVFYFFAIDWSNEERERREERKEEDG